MNSILISLLLMVYPNVYPANNSAIVTLHIEITNVKAAKGKLRIGVYKPEEQFGNAHPSVAEWVDVKSAGNKKVFFKLEPGQYAIAVFHDLNDNGELDKNFVGIPKEPYGFSNDFRPKFSAPSFKDCAFEVAGHSEQYIRVKLTD